ncbi:hypothetical protein EMIHUDRAFT_247579 [Emiliania huxleyi CCMP1516]|uniref:Chromo domain-containing protein n=2 Tax=Emiliania huxleyi TaxID=2903 RepID=A0A0D3ILU2_EMIH1|nr:hypothetical protein EMIHUDRAFT_247579 [Emiliania huxleyi CCMP1516]EOD12227.1 hypothetical protein EMIHUDRAFT_247579 [Emiliania huxleyi CCMP1516]|eukprot:XP_005764656.1 hypothetical protein EMIHUDRAFT_247579 [Emiliania huxleyi CCMP1516]
MSNGQRGPFTKNRYLTESNQNRRRSGRGRKRLLLPDSYNVQKVIAWRQRAGGIELLTAWEDYDVDGWTWEPLDNIPQRFVRACGDSGIVHGAKCIAALNGVA